MDAKTEAVLIRLDGFAAALEAALEGQFLNQEVHLCQQVNNLESSPRASGCSQDTLAVLEARALKLLPHDIEGYVRALGKFTSILLPRPSSRALGMLKTSLKQAVKPYHFRLQSDQTKRVVTQAIPIRKAQPLAVD